MSDRREKNKATLPSLPSEKLVNLDTYHARRGAHSASKARVRREELSQPPVRPVIAFERRELDVLLRLYGRKVASGEWRDYAIDHLSDRAVFSIFRRASEMPLYRIEKNPKFARRQGIYSVAAAGGLILKRGADLAQVLRVLEKKREPKLVRV